MRGELAMIIFVLAVLGVANREFLAGAAYASSDWRVQAFGVLFLVLLIAFLFVRYVLARLFRKSAP